MSQDFNILTKAIVEVRRDKRDCYWITEKYYKTDKTDAQIAEVVAAYNFNKVYPDPENQGAIQELLNRGVNVCEVIKGKDSIKNGINKIRELFKQGRLKIHKDSINLIFELENYHYPKTKDVGNQDELPVKENDHCLDALRYVILMEMQCDPNAVYMQQQQFNKNEYNIRNLSNK